MKRIVIISIAFISVVNLIAQPTLNVTSFPKLGNSFFARSYQAPQVSEGSSGASATWDFTALPLNTDSIPFLFRDPFAAGAGSQFPGSDLFREIQSIQMEFLQVTDSTVIRLGDSNASSGLAIPYSPGFREWVLPSTYLDSYTDSVNASFEYGGISYIRSGTFSSEFDAYGTLLTPVGTYSNVLRRKTDFVWKDSSITGQGTTVTPGLIRSFSWYSPEYRSPLMEYRYTQMDTGTGPYLMKLIYFFEPLSTAFEEAMARELNVYPNPSDGVVEIGTVSYPCSVRLMTVKGELLMEKEIETARRIDLGSHPKGIYYLEIQTGTRRSVKKIIMN